MRLSEKTTINNCLGQRFIASDSKGKKISFHGTPGNDLGAYLIGSEITVFGNAQDALGDTMNAGRIIIHGNVGDAAGYAMRNGEIYFEGAAGYRAGIHMKEYEESKPVMVIGGSCGCFLGEYQAGGLIIVLGLNAEQDIVGSFCGTGMHGGKIFLCRQEAPKYLPKQVKSAPASKEDMQSIKKYLRNYCKYFSADYEKISSMPFTVLYPDSDNPYRQIYIQNKNIIISLILSAIAAKSCTKKQYGL